MTCIFTNIAFSLKTEMFGLNDTAVRKLILDDILQVLKSQVQKYPVTVNFHSTLKLCLHYTTLYTIHYTLYYTIHYTLCWIPFRGASVNTPIRYVILHFRDRRDAASLRYRKFLLAGTERAY